MTSNHAPAHGAPPRSIARETDITAVLAIAALGVLGYLVRHTLSPDGVAYLDLAGMLQRGDFRHFVQGYWSPLYPVLLAGVRAVTGTSTGGQLALAHGVNVAAAAVTVVVIRRWARIMTTPWFGRAAIAALIVCSAEPPRVEALTPDLMLLGLLACIGYETIVRRGERWFLLGVLFGAAYLTKTSVWPWLLVAMALRTLAAPSRADRVATLRSHAVTVAVMLCWIVPLSWQAGHATFGSTGRLNYHWYLESSDDRTPDTHLGDHARYRRTAIAGDAAIVTAEFDTAAGWTYHPWSSPDDWSHGIISHRATPPTLSGVLGYWADNLWLTVTLWLGTLLIAVLLPSIVIGRRPGCWRVLLAEERTTLLMMMLGGAGIAQYVAVHAEPRLLAPFALLFTLAWLDWRIGDRAAAGRQTIRSAPSTLDRSALSLLGLAVAAYVLIARIYHAIDDDRRIAAGLVQLEAANAAAFAPTAAEPAGLAGALSAAAPAHPRVVVVGPAIPVLANVYWVGGRIIAQVPPTSASLLGKLPMERQRDLLHQLFHDRADAVWLTQPDGSFQIARVP